MPKRIKKPPVKPEVRRDWLRRYEAGETPPKIAEADEFDVRTVRKHIDLARREREVQEARSTVLRNALEQHYRDLWEAAEKLDSQIAAEKGITLPIDRDRLLGALREHLPRIPLWKNLQRWNGTLDDLANLEKNIRQRLQQETTSNHRLQEVSSQPAGSIANGIVEALVFQMKSWARGWKGLDVGTDIHLKPADKGFVTLQYGSFHMGLVEEHNAERVREVLGDFETKTVHWEETEEMEKLFKRLETLQKNMRDGLAVIILRRIVPGKCKYCPL